MNPYDRLLENARQYLIGGEYNANDPRIAFVLNEIDARVFTYRQTLKDELERDTHQHAQTASCLKMLAAMGMAYTQKGTALYRDDTLRGEVLRGLEYISKHRYSPNIAVMENTGDWWFKEISCGLALCYCLILMKEHLSDAQRKGWLAAYVAYNPYGYDFGTSEWGKTYGVNRLEKCFIYIILAALNKDDETMRYAMDGLNEVFEFAGGLNMVEGTKNYMDLFDGFYPDGSFMQHVGVAHTGGYGTALLENLPFICNAVHGTPWAFTPERMARIRHWLRYSYIPVMFRGGVMDFVKDREISRKLLQSHMMGHRIACAVCGLSEAFGGDEKDFLKSVVKGWIKGDGFLDFFSYPHEENQRLSINATVRMAQLLDDEGIEPIYDFTHAQVFAAAARAVQFRPGYAFNVAMNSARNKYYESIHGESLRSWYINEGMTCFYDADALGHYDEGYWATVDPYRLPGTTVDTVRRADREAASASEFIYSGEAWAGGVAYGGYAICGYQLSAYGVSLKAKKSWFMSDGKIICLGADINSHDGRDIETIIENRRINGDINIISGEGFMHLPWGGYIFPQPLNLHRVIEKRTGDWQAIGHSRGTETNTFFTLWHNHGKNPCGDEYAYVFLPRAAAEETRRTAEFPSFTIVENTNKAQAVKDDGAGVTGINFWEAHTVCGVTSDNPASVLLHEHDGRLTIAVSDPTWENDGGIHLKINRAVTEITQSDEDVAIERTAPALVLTIKTRAALSQGKTYVIQATLCSDQP
ncbi:MAG: polysaccharide lyase 8 family protein [Defluviitaleaceae bacterium]|nr:polysaccharide lyase 8 family protein [Defluviitaleaceae bacterium]